MTTKHTPGPWRTTDREDVWEIAPIGHGEPLAEITYTGGNAGANARLIAAAPSLADALSAIVGVLNRASDNHTLASIRWPCSCTCEDCPANMARAALAAAGITEDS